MKAVVGKTPISTIAEYRVLLQLVKESELFERSAFSLFSSLLHSSKTYNISASHYL